MFGHYNASAHISLFKYDYFHIHIYVKLFYFMCETVMLKNLGEGELNVGKVMSSG